MAKSSSSKKEKIEYTKEVKRGNYTHKYFVDPNDGVLKRHVVRNEEK